ncbi:MAG TPA: hypothetical protein VF189_00460 [Patescibacteria group bacterium]
MTKQLERDSRLLQDTRVAIRSRINFNSSHSSDPTEKHPYAFSKKGLLAKLAGVDGDYIHDSTEMAYGLYVLTLVRKGKEELTISTDKISATVVYNDLKKGTSVELVIPNNGENMPELDDTKRQVLRRATRVANSVDRIDIEYKSSHNLQITNELLTA